MFNIDKQGTQKPDMSAESAANVSRDKLHMNTHLRQVALEKALITKGLLCEQDIEEQLVAVVQQVAQQVAAQLGIDLDDQKGENLNA